MPSSLIAASDHLNVPTANGDSELDGLGSSRQSLVGHRGLRVRIVAAKSYEIIFLLKLSANIASAPF